MSIITVATRNVLMSAEDHNGFCFGVRISSDNGAGFFASASSREADYVARVFNEIEYLRKSARDDSEKIAKLTKKNLSLKKKLNTAIKDLHDANEAFGGFTKVAIDIHENGVSRTAIVYTKDKMPSSHSDVTGFRTVGFNMRVSK